MPLDVHVLMNPDETDQAALAAGLDPDVRGEVRITWGRALPDPARFEVLVAGRPAREHLAASARLRALIIPFAGLPRETRALMADHPGVAVHNLHHNAAATAEMTVALLLAAAKRLIPLDRALRAGDWTPRYRPTEAIGLCGRTAVILGHGAIGRRVGDALRALGMQVYGFRTRDGDRWRARLPEADALIVTLPLTPATRGLVGAAELARLPRGAVLVNTGRAEVVDEEALYAALTGGPLGAAGLDVWYRYPASAEARADTPPSRFPIASLDNVVASPHRAGTTTDTETVRMKHLAALISACARGERIPNRVDLAAGY